MSLNWKEIDLILSELDLRGAQIQKAVQSAFDVLSLKLFGRNGAKTLLISLSPSACRMHEAFDSSPKGLKPLRFAEFLNSRLINSRIEQAEQLKSDRIVRLSLRREGQLFFMYIRLWSNAANVIVTDADGKVLDAMRRLPKKQEVSGGFYAPFAFNSSDAPAKPQKVYEIRDFSPELLAELPSDASFNRKIDAFYRAEGGALSLKALREEATRKFEANIAKTQNILDLLREKEEDFSRSARLREYADIIMANLDNIKSNDQWLEAENFFCEPASLVRIKLNPDKGAVSSAEDYYQQYRKAKSGLAEVQARIKQEESELKRLEEALAALLDETNPLVLHKRLKSQTNTSMINAPSVSNTGGGRSDSKRPGITFSRKDWLIIVGRTGAENDTLLRKHVKGNDLWLHARDYSGSYVFIKQRRGKSVPLDILLDAGNLAIFYSKGRNNGQGDLFYTQVKYLRRAKNGPKGLVIPTQEKNLHIRLEAERLRELQQCRIEK